MNRRIALGIVAIAAALPGLWLDRPLFYAAWLAAWWLLLGIVLGALVNAWLHRLTGGAWGDALRPATSLLARRMPWLLLAFVPLLSGLPELYPWLRDDAWRSALAQPAFNRLWLAPGGFGLRLALYALVWWWLARPTGLQASRRRAAVSLLAHAVVTSLAGVDLLMSLLPRWYSTGFALQLLSGQLLAGSAAVVALTAGQCGSALQRRASDTGPPLARDLGNLLLTWLLCWAYLAFTQLLIIWAEDLPREIAWYVPRLQTGWRAIGIALVALQFALPLLALLQRAVKDRPQRLALLASALLATTALDAAWLVLPSVEPASVNGWWLLPLLLAGLGLLLFGDVPRRLAAAEPGSLHDARRSA